jgi:small subunit ribosomal protein S3
MEERKIVKFKKEEFAIKEKIKEILGKGKVSRVRIEYTPIGEKIVVTTDKPGLVIGRKGEKIEELTLMLKNNFKFENPRIDIEEIKNPNLDAQLIADDIALSLEKLGPLKFKVIAYKNLQRIMNAGALGAEIVLGGKLPSSRAKTWRFSQGYLRKVGDTAKVVERARAIANTRPGTVGVKVSILAPDAKLADLIKLNPEIIDRLKINSAIINSPQEKEETKTKRKRK